MKNFIQHLLNQIMGLVLLVAIGLLAAGIYSGAPYSIYVMIICVAIWIVHALFKRELNSIAEIGRHKNSVITILVLRTFRNLLIINFAMILPLIMLQAIINNVKLYRMKNNIESIEAFLLWASNWVHSLGLYWLATVILAAFFIPLLASRTITGRVTELAFKLSMLIIFFLVTSATFTFFASWQSSHFAEKVKFYVRDSAKDELNSLHREKVSAAVWHKLEDEQPLIIKEVTKVVQTALVAQTSLWAYDEFRKIIQKNDLDFYQERSLREKRNAVTISDTISSILRGDVQFSAEDQEKRFVYELLWENSQSLSAQNLEKIFQDKYDPYLALEQLRVIDAEQDTASSEARAIREVFIESTSNAISVLIPDHSPEIIKSIVGSAIDALAQEVGSSFREINTLTPENLSVALFLETAQIQESIKLTEVNVSAYYERVTPDSLEKTFRDHVKWSLEHKIKYPHGIFGPSYDQRWKSKGFWDDLKSGRIKIRL